MRFFWLILISCFTIFLPPVFAQEDTGEFYIRFYGAEDLTAPTTPTLLTADPVASTQVDVTWQGVTESIVGRTLEEAFALENLEWCQDKKRSDLKLRIPKNETLSLGKLADRLHKRIKSTSFKKTDFALALLAEEPKAWAVPDYIAKGLHWLQDEVTPLPPTEHSVPVVDEVVT